MFHKLKIGKRFVATNPLKSRIGTSENIPREASFEDCLPSVSYYPPKPAGGLTVEVATIHETNDHQYH
jgi:hypothetical protein